MIIWKNKLAGFAILLLLLPHESTEEGDEPMMECPQDVIDDGPRCPPTNTYVVNVNGALCRVTLNLTESDCPDGPEMEDEMDSRSESDLKATGRWINPELETDYTQCTRDSGPIIIDQASMNVGDCHSYRVPVCEDGKHNLTIWTMGGSDETASSNCYTIQINGEQAARFVYLNYLESSTCPRTEVRVKLKVDKSQTEVMIGKQIIPVQNGEFSLDVCFTYCEADADELQVVSVVMTKSVVDGAPVKPCSVGGPRNPSPPPPPISPPPPSHPPGPSQPTSDCKHYNGDVPSKCWGHGCQYFLRSDKGATCASGRMSCETKSYRKCICSHSFCEQVTAAAADCKPEPPIFNGKLTCRRAKTHYIYHPKQHCYNEWDSGNCMATVVHAVNHNGLATTDNRGITYSNDIIPSYSDPHLTRLPVLVCARIKGIMHLATKLLYATAIIGKPYLNNMDGKCVSYPVPICQSGEYMLTIKMTEDWSDRVNSKCSEVRLNSVPIMVHLDPWTLSGNVKCGAADAVLMFIAEGGDDNDPESDRFLHLKGHDEPIQVKGGRMNLEYCYGYDCCHIPTNDGCPGSSSVSGRTIPKGSNSYQASAFSLERLGDGTKKCR